MGFIDSLRGLFKKDNVEVNLSEMQQVEQAPRYNQEILDKINALNIDHKDLALDKIEGEAETINSYLKGLIKDITRYADLMDNKEKQVLIVNAISGKIKVITQHSLELKNLIAHLEERYYEHVLGQLKYINEKTNKEELRNIIEEFEREREIVRSLDIKITRIIAYDELFNPEKNKEYEGEIKKEVTKREIHTNINELTSHLLNEVITKGMSLKSRIEKRNISDKVKRILEI
ncbi:MAG TPA: hypothetical protein VJG30_00075 [Candidatus Nanoarchaeia archaeon]|nr:hypothetical protein [Candidatus Nanoarchaeia archaeon]